MILVIAVVLLLLEKIVLKPLRLLTQFTQQLDIHETDVHKLTRRSDEIGLLSRAFQEQFTCQQQLNDELLKMSTHDALTGLPNRRLFDQQLETAFSDTSTDSDSVAVMMLDIDHFKLYNDHYGHPEGDVCLQRIADAMYSLARTRDFFIARTGGEEFCALLPHISPDKARGIGEQLLAAIDGLQIPHSTSPVKPFVTISVGIAMQKDAKYQSPSAVVSCADQALYLAKEAGRHQVAFFSPQLASGLTPEHNAPQ